MSSRRLRVVTVDGVVHDVDVPPDYTIEENMREHRSPMLRTPVGSFLLTEVAHVSLEEPA